MSGTVWTRFFWSDWESDPAVRLCSYAAQGLWMRMLCIAAAHDPIGYVAVAGRPLSEDEIARMTGGSLNEVSVLLGELERNGVFSRDRLKRIYSRRMTRDAKKAAVSALNGKKGGNPNLSKDKVIANQVNHHLPITSDHSPEKEKSLVPTPKAPTAAKKARLPEDFPSPEAKGAAIVHWNKNGRPDLSANVEDQAAQFRDHHTAHGKKMEDWAAAWRTWIRNALQMTRPPRVTLGVVSAAAPPDQATWVRRLVYFYEGDEDAGVDVGYWSAQFGPKPGQPGCKVPPEAIAAYRARKPPSAATGGP